MSRVASVTDVVPEPCRIIGTALRPFCLGHHLLFKRLALPFTFDPTAPFEKEQMVIGIVICAGESYEWTLGQMLRNRWQGVVEDWKRRARGPVWRRQRVDWGGAEGLFRAYLTDGYRDCPTWKYASQGVELSAPWELLLKVRLVASGFSESEALNGYLPARWYDYFTANELRQLETCRDAKNWKRVFYTRSDAEKMGDVA